MGDKGKPIKSYKELDVYQGAMDLCMEIFEITKRFPAEEKYSLTDQVRRCSRSVCANIGEAWRKRMYPAAFISKLSDAEAEACETEIWLEIAFRCQYLKKEQCLYLQDQCDHVMARLFRMTEQPEKWSLKK